MGRTNIPNGHKCLMGGVVMGTNVRSLRLQVRALLAAKRMFSTRKIVTSDLHRVWLPNGSLLVLIFLLFSQRVPPSRAHQCRFGTVGSVHRLPNMALSTTVGYIQRFLLISHDSNQYLMTTIGECFYLLILPVLLKMYTSYRILYFLHTKKIKSF